MYKHIQGIKKIKLIASISTHIAQAEGSSGYLCYFYQLDFENREPPIEENEI